jgi:hypothetical protein
MKNTFYFLTLLVFIVVACNPPSIDSSADKDQQMKTEVAMQEANRQVGMPAISNFQEMKNLKWIYELCDQEDFICHAYLSLS